MSDTLDLTILSGTVLEMSRELRLLRLQVDQLAGGLPPRLAIIEQSFHELVGEVSRGFGQMQQQTTRLETRVDLVGAKLAEIQADLKRSDETLAEILAAVKAGQTK